MKMYNYYDKIYTNKINKNNKLYNNPSVIKNIKIIIILKKINYKKLKFIINYTKTLTNQYPTLIKQKTSIKIINNINKKYINIFLNNFFRSFYFKPNDKFIKFTINNFIKNKFIYNFKNYDVFFNLNIIFNNNNFYLNYNLLKLYGFNFN